MPGNEVLLDMDAAKREKFDVGRREMAKVGLEPTSTRLGAMLYTNSPTLPIVQISGYFLEL
jgi:hypothetical protein